MSKKKRKNRKAKPEPKPVDHIVLQDGEREQLLRFITERPKTVKNIRTELLFDIMLNTAISHGEICNLRLQDTPDYFGDNLIHVHKANYIRNRNEPISSRLAEKIKEYIANTRPKTLPKHVRKADLTGLLFYSKLHRQYKPNGLYKFVELTGKQAGVLKKVTPRVLRHTFSAELKEARDRRLAKLMEKMYQF